MGSDGVDACHDASATPRDEDQLASGDSVGRGERTARAVGPVGVFRRRRGEDRRGRRSRRRLRSSDGGSSAILRYVSDLDRRMRGASGAARLMTRRTKRSAAASADDASTAARLACGSRDEAKAPGRAPSFSSPQPDVDSDPGRRAGAVDGGGRARVDAALSTRRSAGPEEGHDEYVSAPWRACAGDGAAGRCESDLHAY